MNARRCRKPAPGYFLVELAAATAVAGILVVGLAGATSIALRTRASTVVSDDLATQAGFAMGRRAAVIRATTPPATASGLAGAVANSTGSWLAPVTYTFTPASGILTETNSQGTYTLATRVTAFSAALHTVSPTSSAVLMPPVIDLSLTLGASGQVPVTLTSSIRLGGGILP